MTESGHFFVVEERVLPQVILRVQEAKDHLAAGRAHSAAEAARLAGISRSAYYKYKDAIFPFGERAQGRLLTLRMVLRDRPGVLAGVLAELCAAGVNILTMNQSTPVNGAAAISINARLDEAAPSPAALFTRLRSLEGVEGIEPITE